MASRAGGRSQTTKGKKRAHDSPQRTSKKRRTIVKHVEFDNGATMSQFKVAGMYIQSFSVELLILVLLLNMNLKEDSSVKRRSRSKKASEVEPVAEKYKTVVFVSFKQHRQKDSEELPLNSVQLLSLMSRYVVYSSS